MVFKDLWRALTKNDLKDKKNIFKDKRRLPWNLYEGEILGTYYRKFYFVNIFLKYRVISFFTNLVGFFFKKNLETKPKKTVYNHNINFFEKAWEDSIDDWVAHFLSLNKPNREKMIKDYKTKVTGVGSVSALRLIKRVILTLYLNDSAYREFANMFIFNLTNEVLKFYKSKKIDHILYSKRDAYDINYLICNTKQELMRVTRDTDLNKRISLPEELKHTLDNLWKNYEVSKDDVKESNLLNYMSAVMNFHKQNIDVRKYMKMLHKEIGKRSKWKHTKE